VRRLQDIDNVLPDAVKLGQLVVDPFENPLESPALTRVRRLAGIEASQGIYDFVKREA
jgi:hypothetical protein